jgi:hypothetical protein
VSSLSVLKVKPRLTLDDVVGLLMFFTFFPDAIEIGFLDAIGVDCVTVDVG